MSDGALRTMPLHAITEVHGETGLRDRFAMEIEDYPPVERERLETALELAARLHRHQRRIREPYLNHLLRVAIRIIHYYGISDTEVIIAALLHDSVEDHPFELAGLPATEGHPPTDEALAVLRERFGARVAGMVASVTNPVYTADRDHHLQYREHLQESLDADPWARVIKISDFTDNGVGVIYISGPKALSSARKYRPLLPILRDLVTRADTPLEGPVRLHILEQLDLAETRFAAILDGTD
ncbi:hypothetical protein F4553_005554 [Allocatelliglobosispora scoriae]|uniref:HD domain-containing protein n=1 Tax=Allocatelliglobosispora scoriae TaxID=643052 RepID=A0A841BZI4_9ACTN|nr:HD domain-containing protein [Allocatelliglobosispora scoriae]MBB5872120.1 hypothetical protein [Allocatelliglobosispora scoriae]